MTKRVQIIDRRKFAEAALNLIEKAFLVYEAYLGTKMSINPAREAEIASMITKKVTILAEYLNFANIFFWKKQLQGFPSALISTSNQLI